jgi:hypothetical protein
VAVGGAGAGGETLLHRDETRAVPVPAAAPSSSVGHGRAVARPVSPSRASQGAGHVRAGKAMGRAKRRVGHPGRSYGSERRGGPSNRASVPGHVKQDKAPPRAGPKRNHNGAPAKAKGLAGAPAKPAKPKLPKAQSKAGGRSPREAKPFQFQLP